MLRCLYYNLSGQLSDGTDTGSPIDKVGGIIVRRRDVRNLIARFVTRHTKRCGNMSSRHAYTQSLLLRLTRSNRTCESRKKRREMTESRSSIRTVFYLLIVHERYGSKRSRAHSFRRLLATELRGVLSLAFTFAI